MSALFVTDPLEGLEADIDATVGLMPTTQQHDAAVWVCEPEDLSVEEGRLRARARRITLRPRARRGDHRWRIDPTWFDEEERRILDVAATVQTVLLRIDPPVDTRYLHTTYVLDVAAAGGVTVANNPGGVRALHEKLGALRFPDLCPPTLVSADPAAVRSFVDVQGAVVVKPVDGFAGTDVWLLRRHDPNVDSLVESATRLGRRHVIAQQYLAAVDAGNKRLFLLDGEIIGAVLRRPSPTDFRIGPPVVPAAIDEHDHRIVAALAPTLAANGIVMAGLDVIDGRLIEVNVTCPGGMHKTDALLGTDLSGATMRRLLAPTHERVRP